MNGLLSGILYSWNNGLLPINLLLHPVQSSPIQSSHVRIVFLTWMISPEPPDSSGAVRRVIKEENLIS